MHQFVVTQWHHGFMVIATAQPYSTKPELRFCAGFEILLAVCQRFTMVKISDDGAGWK